MKASKQTLFLKLLRHLVVQLGILMMVHGPGTSASTDVMVLHSYHAEYEWVQGVNAGMELVFSHAGISRRYFYMDTKRNPNKEWKVAVAKKADVYRKKHDPDVIIAVDDNAQAYFVTKHLKNSTIPVVFAGVNADPHKYAYPADHITGILERSYPEQVMQLMQKINPAIRRIAWVSDNSATANLVLERVRRKALVNHLPLPVVGFDQPAIFDHWKATITRIDANPDIGALLIPLYHTVKHGVLGKSMPPSEVMQWTVAHTRKPVFGFWPFSVTDGALGAVAVDPREHGKVAAQLAVKIFQGQKPGSIPVVKNQDGSVHINLKAADRLKIQVPFEVLLSADRIIE